MPPRILILLVFLATSAQGAVEIAPGAVVDGFPNQAFTASAGSGGESLIVWRERTPNGDRLNASLLRHDAGTIRSDPFPIFSTTGLMGAHAVAFSGEMYLVVWHWWQHLYAVRISRSGEILDADPIIISQVTRADSLMAASSGHEFLVAWREAVFRTAVVQLSGDPAGALDLDTGTPNTAPGSADLTSDSRRYLLVWTEAEFAMMFPGPTPPFHLHGVILDRSGIADRLTQTLLVRDVSLISEPGATSSGTEFLVTYRALAHQAVSAVVVMGEHSLFAGSPLQFAAWSGRYARPVWDGQHYLVAIGGTLDAHLLFVRLDRDGSVVRRLVQRPRRSLQSLHIAPGAANDGSLIITTELQRLFAWRENELSPAGRMRIVR